MLLRQLPPTGPLVLRICLKLNCGFLVTSEERLYFLHLPRFSTKERHTEGGGHGFSNGRMGDG